jgi:hypothetical protein
MDVSVWLDVIIIKFDRRNDAYFIVFGANINDLSVKHSKAVKIMVLKLIIFKTKLIKIKKKI